ncbi:Hypothetical protein SMAX5B_002086 [Scomber scombrus]|uniref:Uncharacterized protein n=1 Tax=Scomber scombrus TaxID=13677 RepID=A0AAV1QDV2_SCOSC
MSHTSSNFQERSKLPAITQGWVNFLVLQAVWYPRAKPSLSTHNVYALVVLAALTDGIPSEDLPDVTCDVRAEVTQAGRRRLVDEASQKRVKATDICQCASQSEKGCGMKWSERLLRIFFNPDWDAGRWTSICLADGRACLLCDSSVSAFMPVRRLSP